MQAEHLWLLLFRQLVDVVAIGLSRAISGSSILFRLRVNVFVVEIVYAEVLFEGGKQAAPILVVSDTTSIIDVTSHEDQGIPWDLLLIVQENLQHRKRSLQVTVIEFVRNVPSERTELSTLLNNSVEEGSSEDQLAITVILFAVVEPIVGDLLERPLQVCLDASWRLSSQLDSVLEHTDGEEIDGH